MKKYNVGDKVWLAYAGTKKISKVCTVCYGKKSVNLILGNDDVVTLPCTYCGNAYDSPKGITEEYEYVSEVKQVTIDKITINQTAIGETIEYQYNNGRIIGIDRMFDTKEEAEVKCVELIKKYELDQITTRENIKKNSYKNYAWNAGYHTKEANKLRKQADRHDLLAIICKSKARE